MHRIKFPILIVQQVPRITCQRCGNTVEMEDMTAGKLISRFLEPSEGQGVDIAEMEIRMSIARKVRLGHDHVDLENEEWGKLQAGVDSLKFTRTDEDVLACGIAIRDAEEMEVEVKEKSKEGKDQYDSPA